MWTVLQPRDLIGGPNLKLGDLPGIFVESSHAKNDGIQVLPLRDQMSAAVAAEIAALARRRLIWLEQI